MMSVDRLRDEDAAEMLGSMALDLARKKLEEERAAGNLTGRNPQDKGAPPTRK